MHPWSCGVRSVSEVYFFVLSSFLFFQTRKKSEAGEYPISSYQDAFRSNNRSYITRWNGRICINLFRTRTFKEFPTFLKMFEGKSIENKLNYFLKKKQVQSTDSNFCFSSIDFYRNNSLDKCFALRLKCPLNNKIWTSSMFSEIYCDQDNVFNLEEEKKNPILSIKSIKKIENLKHLFV